MAATNRLAHIVWIVAAFSLLGNTVAWADDQLNCKAYADQAVGQQQQNQTHQCGLQGIGWSDNFQEHFAWCQLPQVTMGHLTQADQFRVNAINQCLTKNQADQEAAAQLDIACGQYAIRAREQNQENHKHKCGLVGGRWSDDVNGHRAWCMQASVSARSQEIKLRQDEIVKCSTVKEFHNPKGRKVKGRRWPLDECDSHLELFCGETIARNFCKNQGFKDVAYFVKESESSPPAGNLGTAPVVSSYLDSDGYCGGKTCTYFKLINCKGVN